MGASYYLQTQFEKKEGTVPEINLENEKKLQELLISQMNKIRAAHDLSEGGLLVCLAEMLFNNSNLGASVYLFPGNAVDRLDTLLFGESQGRVIVAVNSENCDALQNAAKEAGVQIDSLGQVNESSELKVIVDGNEILSSRVEELHLLWENTIPDHMESSKR